MPKPQLWMLVGGDGTGKTSFYEQFLKPEGLPFVNADVIARDYFPEDPQGKSRQAALMAERLRYRLLEEKTSFCFETVFSHVSKIDFLGDAKAAGYNIIMVLIHLEHAGLNKARVNQRVKQGGHTVPEERIEPRIERLLVHVRQVINLGLDDELHLLDNSNYENPFVRIASISQGVLSTYVDVLPQWATEVLNEMD